jgi:tRNA U38,U39,U40 pseudouridine synthase TruA
MQKKIQITLSALVPIEDGFSIDEHVDDVVNALNHLLCDDIQIKAIRNVEGAQHAIAASS